MTNGSLTLKAFRIDGRAITTWDTFHDVFFRVFGFSGFYGNNRDAWIDCMSSLDLDEGPPGVRLAPGEVALLELEHADVLRAKALAIYDFLHEGCGMVNGRRMAVGEMPMVLLTHYLGERVA